MYTVSVRDHFMIAHSFRGETFGPAQRLHGATYVVDVAFVRPELDADGVVVDIGKASDTVRAILGKLNFQNLDEIPEFSGRNTTTEFLAKEIFDRTAEAIRRGDLGETAAGISLISLVRVTLHESHVAWAAFEGAPSKPNTRAL
jgi:6-pyruvoyltetrahydropterin/6-carboxytetrahydropterin synthase